MLRRAEESFRAAMIFWGVGNLEKDSFFESEDVSAYVLSHFEQAMDEGWIQIYYQPVIRSMTGSVCGAEALCRWIDPGHGLISPGQMIPVLENSKVLSAFKNETDRYLYDKEDLDTCAANLAAQLQ